MIEWYFYHVYGLRFDRIGEMNGRKRIEGLEKRAITY